MLANYGYSDGSGDYFLTIDTGKCDGCGKCVEVCEEGVLEVANDDFGKMVARVKEKVASQISYVCLGVQRGCGRKDSNCQTVCTVNAISLTW